MLIYTIIYANIGMRTQAQKDAQKRYFQSPKGKEAIKRYHERRKQITVNMAEYCPTCGHKLKKNSIVIAQPEYPKPMGKDTTLINEYLTLCIKGGVTPVREVSGYALPSGVEELLELSDEEMDRLLVLEKYIRTGEM